MALGVGVRLGSYEVLSPLGAGGMGEVYRARDSRLGRDVAIKVLPTAFAADHDRMVRFRREAHVLASLNHPHIASIFGLEESDGTPQGDFDIMILPMEKLGSRERTPGVLETGPHFYRSRTPSTARFVISSDAMTEGMAWKKRVSVIRIV